jgi:hypothetical protein
MTPLPLPELEPLELPEAPELLPEPEPLAPEPLLE